MTNRRKESTADYWREKSDSDLEWFLESVRSINPPNDHFLNHRGMIAELAYQERHGIRMLPEGYR